jgi:PRC-barrel domain
MNTNYVTRDNFGMYANSNAGSGPALMGADTLLGNDVYNKDGEDLGDIKELMVDMAALKDAPGFDKGHWPTMSDKTWASDVHKFYGTSHSAE